jgi:hypothetical protein
LIGIPQVLPGVGSKPCSRADILGAVGAGEVVLFEIVALVRRHFLEQVSLDSVRFHGVVMFH